MKKTIDLRSDNVVKPDMKMLSIMFGADVGHEGWEEDINITKLENRFAEMCGKESAVFLPSMSVAHILVAMAVCKKTDEVIVEFNSHLFQHAASSLSSLVGVQLHPIIASNRKYLSLSDIEPHIRNFEKYPSTSMIVLENPHTIYGGVKMPIDVCKDIYKYTRSCNIHLYLDGARLLYTCKDRSYLMDYCKYADSIGICLTKGLGCPYGALLASNSEIIKKVRYYKKVMGLNLHYIGYFASAATYALEMYDQILKKDIQNAKYLFKKLSQVSLLKVEPPETNIICFSLKEDSNLTKNLVKKLALNGVLALNYSGNMIRLVLNATVTRNDLNIVVEKIKSILHEEYLDD